MSIAISDGTGSIIVTYSTNKQIKNVELFSFPATADADQADYVSFSNVAGDIFGAWLDIDAAGTEPTGLFYGNSDTEVKVSIVAGGTAIQNAAAFVTAFNLIPSTGITLTDNEDGTVLVTNDAYGWSGDGVSMNADDSATGSIDVTPIITGLGTSVVRTDSYAKGQLNLVADTNRNEIVFNSIGTTGSAKGNPSQRFKYEEITAPSSTDVLDLKSQIDAWNVVSGSGGVSDLSNFVVNEAASPAEMTGSNNVFTTNNAFVTGTSEVFYNQLKMTLGVDYTENGALGTITFDTITPDNTLPTPDTLTFNYIKL